MKIVHAQFMDNQAKVSPVSTDTIALGSPVGISQARGTAVGQQAIVADAAVTAVFPDCLYVESADRTSGIKILGQMSAVEGNIVDIVGAAVISDGEPAIQMTTCAMRGSGPVGPLGMSGKSAVGNTGGLLVRAWGLTSAIDDSRFGITDGSGSVVEVLVPSGVAVPPPYKYVVLTGVSSTYTSGGILHRRLRVSSQQDIAVIL